MPKFLTTEYGGRAGYDRQASEYLRRVARRPAFLSAYDRAFLHACFHGMFRGSGDSRHGRAGAALSQLEYHRTSAVGRVKLSAARHAHQNPRVKLRKSACEVKPFRPSRALAYFPLNVLVKKGFYLKSEKLSCAVFPYRVKLRRFHDVPASGRAALDTLEPVIPPDKTSRRSARLF